MNNQLQKVEATSITEISAIGKTFFESGMFSDLKSASQAVVKIMAGAELGLPPFASMTGIHIIQGKPTIGANLIAARVKGSGKYDYKVLQQSDTVCEIEFFQGNKSIGKSKFTSQDADRAKTQNMAKYPANMLFARAISNGVKWYCPDVFAGPVYVPEEMIDIDHEEIPSGTDPKIFEKSAIDPKALKQAIDRLSKGELKTKDDEDLYNKILDTYILDEDQKVSLTAAWQKGCIEADKKFEPLPINQ